MFIIVVVLQIILIFISIQLNPGDSIFKKNTINTIRFIPKYYMAIPLIILFLFACNEKKAIKTDPPKDYSVLTLQSRPTTTFNDFPATLQGENIVEIRPMVDGYLEAIYVQEGAIVKKGQLLFKIKNPLYDQAVITAKATIKIALADVNTAKMDVEKVRPLVEKDIVSKYELESASYTLQSKEASLAQAYATLANANTNLEYTTLRSPQDGVIGSIPYKKGALVTSNTANPLTILANTGNVFAYFSWNEKELLAFMSNIPGNSLQERLTHLPAVLLLLADGSQYQQNGRLETASGLINTETGTASFKAIFPNLKGFLHSGASAVVRLTHKIDAAILVPQSATYELQDKHFVYALLPGNLVFSRAIESKPTNDGQFLIVSNGLKPGDKVVLNGTNLKDSTVITPRYVRVDSIFSQLQKE